MKHTPGPWTGLVADDRSADHGYGYVWPAATGKTIAEVRKGDNVHANTRLISAAPDLLAALQGNLEYLELKAQGFLRDYPPDHCINLTVMRQLDATRAAIRKATGQ